MGYFCGFNISYFAPCGPIHGFNFCGLQIAVFIACKGYNFVVHPKTMINHENNAMKITRYTVMYIGHSSKSNIVDDNTISDCDECADLTDSKSKPEQSKRAINECISLKNFF